MPICPETAVLSLLLIIPMSFVMQNSFRLSPFLFKLKDDKFNNYVALKPFNDSDDTDCPYFFSYLANLEAPEPTGILSSSALEFSERRPYLCQIGR